MLDNIQQIQNFNRIVVGRFGVLRDGYLGQDRPYVEAQIMIEIGTRGATLRHLCEHFRLDPPCVTRIVRNLEDKRLAISSHVTGDRYSRKVHLSRAGLTELGKINAQFDNLARSTLEPLTPDQADRLVAAMGDVERLLRASSVRVQVALPSNSDAEWCVGQYFSELNAQFAGGFAPAATLRGMDRELAPPLGRMLVARVLGEPIGCGAVRARGRLVGEIQLLWVAPHARGLGIARRVLAELEYAAKRMRMRIVRLDCNASLHQALALFRSSGYREIDRFNDNPYAQHWFEKRLGGQSRKI